MKSDDFKTEYPDPWDQGFYQTGSTNPPKSHSGLVAFLLIAVIFLAGIASFLGFMNIRLFSALKEQSGGNVPMALHPNVKTSQPPTVSSTAPDAPTNYAEPEYSQSPAPKQIGMGFTGEPISALYQYYYHLPEGMFITEVIEGSNAAMQGLTSGDILVTLDGKMVTTADELTTFLYDYQVGDTMEAVVYRSNQYHTITLTVEEVEGS
jgi:membrane-associated protease RseP (regulator of RpoE activity)